ncbi:hypothetical protein Pmani_018034 [Petrolisthes manimaculis]|uniref:Chitin-binding type-2 domain-containing protein n=1 Tax=Petrolisthes manimaculis TaxID=1843537 RepID=A0AAE1PNJ2_9EUCA|nr:hypothetical protein Pmani_018034 [Petrolisthes manimaculis]
MFIVRAWTRVSGQDPNIPASLQSGPSSPPLVVFSSFPSFSGDHQGQIGPVFGDPPDNNRDNPGPLLGFGGQSQQPETPIPFQPNPVPLGFDDPIQQPETSIPFQPNPVPLGFDDPRQEPETSIPFQEDATVLPVTVSQHDSNSQSNIQEGVQFSESPVESRPPQTRKGDTTADGEAADTPEGSDSQSGGIVTQRNLQDLIKEMKSQMTENGAPGKTTPATTTPPLTLAQKLSSMSMSSPEAQTTMSQGDADNKAKSLTTPITKHTITAGTNNPTLKFTFDSPQITDTTFTTVPAVPPQLTEDQGKSDVPMLITMAPSIESSNPGPDDIEIVNDKPVVSSSSDPTSGPAPGTLAFRLKQMVVTDKSQVATPKTETNTQQVQPQTQQVQPQQRTLAEILKARQAALRGRSGTGSNRDGTRQRSFGTTSRLFSAGSRRSNFPRGQQSSLATRQNEQTFRFSARNKNTDNEPTPLEDNVGASSSPPRQSTSSQVPSSLPPASEKVKEENSRPLSHTERLLQRLQDLRERRLGSTTPRPRRFTVDDSEVGGRPGLITRNLNTNNGFSPRRQTSTDFLLRLRNRSFTTTTTTTTQSPNEDTEGVVEPPIPLTSGDSLVESKPDTAILEPRTINVLLPTTKRPQSLREKIAEHRKNNRFLPRRLRKPTTTTPSPAREEFQIPATNPRPNRPLRLPPRKPQLNFATFQNPSETKEPTDDSPVDNIRAKLAAMLNSGGSLKTVTTENLMSVFRETTARPFLPADTDSFGDFTGTTESPTEDDFSTLMNTESPAETSKGSLAQDLISRLMAQGIIKKPDKPEAITEDVLFSQTTIFPDISPTESPAFKAAGQITMLDLPEGFNSDSSGFPDPDNVNTHNNRRVLGNQQTNIQTEQKHHPFSNNPLVSKVKMMDTTTMFSRDDDMATTPSSFTPSDSQDYTLLEYDYFETSPDDFGIGTPTTDVKENEIDAFDSVGNLHSLLRSFNSPRVRPELFTAHRVLSISLATTDNDAAEVNLEKPEIAHDSFSDDLETAATEQVLYTTTYQSSGAFGDSVTSHVDLVPTPLNVDVTSLTVSEPYSQVVGISGTTEASSPPKVQDKSLATSDQRTINTPVVISSPSESKDNGGKKLSLADLLESRQTSRDATARPTSGTATHTEMQGVKVIPLSKPTRFEMPGQQDKTSDVTTSLQTPQSEGTLPSDATTTNQKKELSHDASEDVIRERLHVLRQLQNKDRREGPNSRHNLPLPDRKSIPSLERSRTRLQEPESTTSSSRLSLSELLSRRKSTKNNGTPSSVPQTITRTKVSSIVSSTTLPPTEGTSVHPSQPEIPEVTTEVTPTATPPPVAPQQVTESLKKQRSESNNNNEELNQFLALNRLKLKRLMESRQSATPTTPVESITTDSPAKHETTLTNPTRFHSSHKRPQIGSNKTPVVSAVTPDIRVTTFRTRDFAEHPGTRKTSFLTPFRKPSTGLDSRNRGSGTSHIPTSTSRFLLRDNERPTTLIPTVRPPTTPPPTTLPPITLPPTTLPPITLPPITPPSTLPPITIQSLGLADSIVTSPRSRLPPPIRRRPRPPTRFSISQEVFDTDKHLQTHATKPGPNVITSERESSLFDVSTRQPFTTTELPVQPTFAPTIIPYVTEGQTDSFQPTDFATTISPNKEVSSLASIIWRNKIQPTKFAIFGGESSTPKTPTTQGFTQQTTVRDEVTLVPFISQRGIETTTVPNIFEQPITLTAIDETTQKFIDTSLKFQSVRTNLTATEGMTAEHVPPPFHQREGQGASPVTDFGSFQQSPFNGATIIITGNGFRGFQQPRVPISGTTGSQQQVHIPTLSPLPLFIANEPSRTAQSLEVTGFESSATTTSPSTFISETNSGSLPPRRFSLDFSTTTRPSKPIPVRVSSVIPTSHPEEVFSSGPGSIFRTTTVEPDTPLTEAFFSEDDPSCLSCIEDLNVESTVPPPATDIPVPIVTAPITTITPNVILVTIPDVNGSTAPGSSSILFSDNNVQNNQSPSSPETGDDRQIPPLIITTLPSGSVLGTTPSTTPLPQVNDPAVQGITLRNFLAPPPELEHMITQGVTITSEEGILMRDILVPPPPPLAELPTGPQPITGDHDSKSDVNILNRQTDQQDKSTFTVRPGNLNSQSIQSISDKEKVSKVGEEAVSEGSFIEQKQGQHLFSQQEGQTGQSGTSQHLHDNLPPVRAENRFPQNIRGQQVNPQGQSNLQQFNFQQNFNDQQFRPQQQQTFQEQQTSQRQGIQKHQTSQQQGIQEQHIFQDQGSPVQQTSHDQQITQHNQGQFNIQSQHSQGQNFQEQSLQEQGRFQGQIFQEQQIPQEQQQQHRPEEPQQQQFIHQHSFQQQHNFQDHKSLPEHSNQEQHHVFQTQQQQQQPNSLGQIITGGQHNLRDQDGLQDQQIFGLDTTEQPVIQPTTQPITNPTIQTIIQEVIQPTTQPTIQPTEHPTTQTIIQPTTQPIIQPTTQPTTQTIIQPTVQPTTQPIIRAITIQPTQRPHSLKDQTHLQGQQDILGHQNLQEQHIIQGHNIPQDQHDDKNLQGQRNLEEQQTLHRQPNTKDQESILAHQQVPEQVQKPQDEGQRTRGFRPILVRPTKEPNHQGQQQQQQQQSGPTGFQRITFGEFQSVAGRGQGISTTTSRPTTRTGLGHFTNPQAGFLLGLVDTEITELPDVGPSMFSTTGVNNAHSTPPVTEEQVPANPLFPVNKVLTFASQPNNGEGFTNPSNAFNISQQGTNIPSSDITSSITIVSKTATHTLKDFNDKKTTGLPLHSGDTNATPSPHSHHQQNIHLTRPTGQTPDSISISPPQISMTVHTDAFPTESQPSLPLPSTTSSAPTLASPENPAFHPSIRPPDSHKPTTKTHSDPILTANDSKTTSGTISSLPASSFSNSEQLSSTHFRQRIPTTSKSGQFPATQHDDQTSFSSSELPSGDLTSTINIIKSTTPRPTTGESEFKNNGQSFSSFSHSHSSQTNSDTPFSQSTTTLPSSTFVDLRLSSERSQSPTPFSVHQTTSPTPHPDIHPQSTTTPTIIRFSTSPSGSTVPSIEDSHKDILPTSSPPVTTEFPNFSSTISHQTSTIEPFTLAITPKDPPKPTSDSQSSTTSPLTTTLSPVTTTQNSLSFISSPLTTTSSPQNPTTSPNILVISSSRSPPVTSTQSPLSITSSPLTTTSSPQSSTSSPNVLIISSSRSPFVTRPTLPSLNDPLPTLSNTSLSSILLIHPPTQKEIPQKFLLSEAPSTHFTLDPSSHITTISSTPSTTSNPSHFTTSNPFHSFTISPSHSTQTPPTHSDSSSTSDFNTNIHSHSTTSTPSQSTNSPTQFTTSTPSHSTTNFPSHSTTNSPSHSTTNFPSHSTTNSPSHSTTNFPSHSTTNTPSPSTTNSPSHSTTNFPSPSTTNTPSHSTTNTPSLSTTNNPSHHIITTTTFPHHFDILSFIRNHPTHSTQNSHTQSTQNSHTQSTQNPHTQSTQNPHTQSTQNSHTQSTQNSPTHSTQNSHTQSTQNSPTHSTQNSHTHSTQNSATHLIAGLPIQFDTLPPRSNQIETTPSNQPTIKIPSLFDSVPPPHSTTTTTTTTLPPSHSTTQPPPTFPRPDTHSTFTPSDHSTFLSISSTLTPPPPDSTFINPQDSTFNPPESTFSIPDSTFIPPDSTFSSLDSTFIPPDSTFNPPESTFNPPDSTFINPPDSTFNPIDSTFNPPDSTFNPPDTTFINPPDSTFNPPDSTFNPIDSTFINPPDTTFNPPESTFSSFDQSTSTPTDHSTFTTTDHHSTFISNPSTSITHIPNIILSTTLTPPHQTSPFNPSTFADNHSTSFTSDQSTFRPSDSSTFTDPHTSSFAPHSSSTFNPEHTTFSPNPSTFSPNPSTFSPNPSTFAPNPPTFSPNPPTFSPNPSTFSPNPSTFSPNPSTFTPNPSTFTPNPSTFAPNPSTFSPNPSTFAPNPSTFDPNPSTFSPNPSTFAPNPSTFSPNPSTFSPNPSTFSPNPSTFAPNPSIFAPNPSTFAPVDHSVFIAVTPSTFNPNPSTFNPNPSNFDSSPNPSTFAPNPSTFAPNFNPSTFAPNSNPSTFAPNPSTFAPNPSTFAPNFNPSTLAPNSNPSTFAPPNPSTFAPNFNPSTLAPNSNPSTFAPPNPSTFAPNFNPSTLAPNSNPSTFAPPNQNTFTTPNPSTFTTPNPSTSSEHPPPTFTPTPSSSPQFPTNGFDSVLHISSPRPPPHFPHTPLIPHLTTTPASLHFGIPDLPHNEQGSIQFFPTQTPRPHTDTQFFLTQTPQTHTDTQFFPTQTPQTHTDTQFLSTTQTPPTRQPQFFPTQTPDDLSRFSSTRSPVPNSLRPRPLPSTLPTRQSPPPGSSFPVNSLSSHPTHNFIPGTFQVPSSTLGPKRLSLSTTTPGSFNRLLSSRRKNRLSTGSVNNLDPIVISSSRPSFQSSRKDLNTPVTSSLVTTLSPEAINTDTFRRPLTPETGSGSPVLISSSRFSSNSNNPTEPSQNSLSNGFSSSFAPVVQTSTTPPRLPPSRLHRNRLRANSAFRSSSTPSPPHPSSPTIPRRFSTSTPLPPSSIPSSTLSSSRNPGRSSLSSPSRQGLPILHNPRQPPVPLSSSNVSPTQPGRRPSRIVLRKRPLPVGRSRSRLSNNPITTTITTLLPSSHLPSSGPSPFFPFEIDNINNSPPSPPTRGQSLRLPLGGEDNRDPTTTGRVRDRTRSRGRGKSRTKTNENNGVTEGPETTTISSSSSSKRGSAGQDRGTINSSSSSSRRGSAGQDRGTINSNSSSRRGSTGQDRGTNSNSNSGSGRGSKGPRRDGALDPDRDEIPGNGGVDYPTLLTIPKTQFTCSPAMSAAGKLYADPETGCQAYHVCNERQMFSFLCPRGTLFHQETSVCQWWFTVNCQQQAVRIAQIRARGTT